jgi:bifunctional UDP-N-acetylglucosamine pyrophosphorylase / glucosamine-1-phosphate N-acetyltransferase
MTIAVLVLAAGLGKRMKSDLPKVAHAAGRRPLIQHVLHAANELQPERMVVITGHRREVVEQAVAEGATAGLYDGDRIRYAVQSEQKGTGDAVRAALPCLEGFVGTVVILYGDTPLIRGRTVRELLEVHETSESTVTLVSFTAVPPGAYGRVVRDPSGRFVERIVEAKDCNREELAITEVNAGIYAVDSSFLTPAVEGLTNDNAQGEYYLTDIVGRAVHEGQRVSALLLTDADEALGVNSPVELARVERVLSRRRVEELMNGGVIFEDPETAYVDVHAIVHSGARIGPMVHLRGSTEVGTDAVIEGSAYLVDTKIGEGATVKFSVRAEGAVIGARSKVGPFAHLRPNTVLEEEVKIGNFVETKQAHLRAGVSASHLTYLGDCEIGEHSNIGAGTITCNYDGARKHFTKIGKEVFIGSNTALVAPLTIEDGATIGAGSTITKAVSSGSLALTRPSMVVKENYRRPKKGSK